MADMLDPGGDVRLMSTTSPGISDSQGGGLLLGAEHRGDKARSFWATILKTAGEEAHPVVMMSWLLINPTSPPGPPMFSL